MLPSEFPFGLLVVAVNEFAPKGEVIAGSVIVIVVFGAKFPVQAKGNVAPVFICEFIVTAVKFEVPKFFNTTSGTSKVPHIVPVGLFTTVIPASSFVFTVQGG